VRRSFRILLFFSALLTHAWLSEQQYLETETETETESRFTQTCPLRYSRLILVWVRNIGFCISACYCAYIETGTLWPVRQRRLIKYSARVCVCLCVCVCLSVCLYVWSFLRTKYLQKYVTFFSPEHKVSPG